MKKPKYLKGTTVIPKWEYSDWYTKEVQKAEKTNSSVLLRGKEKTHYFRCKYITDFLLPKYIEANGLDFGDNVTFSVVFIHENEARIEASIVTGHKPVSSDHYRYGNAIPPYEAPIIKKEHLTIPIPFHVVEGYKFVPLIEERHDEESFNNNVLF